MRKSGTSRRPVSVRQSANRFVRTSVTRVHCIQTNKDHQTFSRTGSPIILVLRPYTFPWEPLIVTVKYTWVQNNLQLPTDDLRQKQTRSSFQQSSTGQQIVKVFICVKLWDLHVAVHASHRGPGLYIDA